MSKKLVLGRPDESGTIFFYCWKLTDAQVCTHPDLAFVTGILGRFQSNPGIEHWKMVKKALRYVQGTKGLMLTYRRSDSLEIEGYSD